MSRAAFFDFDRTLLDADSQREEALSLMKTPPGLLYLCRLLKVVGIEPFYKKDLITHETFNRVYLSSYKGIPLSTLEAHARKLYTTTLRPRLMASMMERLKAHRQNGDRIAILSATSRHLIAPFIEEVKPDAWADTAIETDGSGVCTGKPMGNVCVGKVKAAHLLRLAEKMGVDPKACIAYSDHHADLEFLEAVGQPVAVNPTARLHDIATQRGWQTLFEKQA